jgi:hypothetical protein
VLTTIDLDDHASFKANEVENKSLKWNLSAKFEKREPPIAQQAPHGRFSVGGFDASSLQFADALRRWPMVWCLRHEPLTRRLTPFGATLSHKGRGKIGGGFRGTIYTRIGIST